MPVLVGLLEADATDLLISEEHELVYVIEYVDLDTPDDPDDGRVTEQSIRAGTEVDRGTEVVIVVGVAPAPTTTTSTTSTTTTTVPPTTSTTTTPPTTSSSVAS
jgi:beta-lactam-binding protein with PASTA domain